MRKKFIFVCLFICFLLLSSVTAGAFVDVSDDYVYSDALEYLVDEGIVSGYPDGTFKPYGNISRAELMKILVKKYVADDEFGLENCFPDVRNEWFAPYVCYAYQHGWVSGYTDGFFKPAATVARAEAIKMLVNSQGLGGEISSYSNDYVFNDVDSSSWYAPYLWVAKIKGILTEPDYGSMYYPDILIDRGTISENLYLLLSTIDIDPLALNGLCYNEECESKNPDYVIVTRPLFVNVIQDFVKWKENNGFDVGVLTVEYIDDTVNADNPAKSIKKTVKEFVSEHGTKYFLLVGDTVSDKGDGVMDVGMMYDMTRAWNVPSGYYCRYDIFAGAWHPEDNGDYSKCIEVTDLYYADFDDSAWEENEDGYIMRGIYSNAYWFDSALGDFVKLKPDYNSTDKYYQRFDVDPNVLDFEAIVARIPVRKPSEFKNVFNKLKNFEPTDTIEFLSDETLFEGSLDSYNAECSHSGVSRDEIASKINNCSQNLYTFYGYFNENNINYFSTTYDLEDEEQFQLARDIVLNMTTAVMPLFHGSHGATEILINEDVGEFSNIFPVWISASCGIGTFSVQSDKDSFTEAMIKASTGPAFVVASTNMYYFFKDALEGRTVGEAFYNIGNVIVRYTSVSNNLFGDPSLKIFDID